MAESRALKTAIRRLSILLEEEKKRLLTGRVFDIEDLIEKKAAAAETLSSRLEGHDAHASSLANALQKLARKARENEGLFQAVKDGAHSARQRLNEVQKKRSNVGVYAPGGDKLLMPNATRRRQKIA